MGDRLSPGDLPDWPRRMGAGLAAAYLGVSVSKLKAGVLRGSYPAPLRDGGRVLWDRKALDRWADAAGGSPLDAAAQAGDAADLDDQISEAIRAASRPAQARQRRQA